MQTRGYLPYKHNLRNMKIDKKLTKNILDWILNNYNTNLFITPNHHGKGIVRGCPKVDTMDTLLYKQNFPFNDIIELEKSIIKHYNLNYPLRDAEYGIFLSYSTEGHRVHLHVDPAAEGDFTLVRFNFLVSKPEEGGNPIINNKVIEVEEDEIWICEASRYYHTTDEVKGDKPRIMISFGYNIPNAELIKINKQ